jgi:hypothetical protein
VEKSCVDSNISYSKCWQEEREFGIQNSAGNRLILLHAGSENGFLDSAVLLCKAETVMGLSQTDEWK